MANVETIVRNDINCSMIICGPKVKFFVAYKQNQKSLDVFMRKYEHNFMASINNNDFEGCTGIELPKKGLIFVSHHDKVLILDNSSMKFKCKLPIKLLKSDSRERTEVLSMTASDDNTKVAVISGSILVGDQTKMNQIFMFSVETNEVTNQWSF